MKKLLYIMLIAVNHYSSYCINKPRFLKDSNNNISVCYEIDSEHERCYQFDNEEHQEHIRVTNYLVVGGYQDQAQEICNRYWSNTYNQGKTQLKSSNTDKKEVSKEEIKFFLILGYQL